MTNIITPYDDNELKIIQAEVEEQSRLDKIQPLKDNFVGNYGHPTCRECIKFYNETRGGHRIDCKGIPQGLDWIPESARNTMNEEELTNAIITVDPVRWLKVYLGWEARDYQEDFLRCSARKSCGRWARRAGKTEACAASSMHGLITQAGVPLIDGEKRGCRILVFSPYGDQIVNLFMKLESFLSRNSDIAGMVVRYIKNPYFMTFNNGSWIMGKSTGSSSKSGAKSSKGWGADRYIVDEACYLDSKDYATIMPMTTEHNQTRITLISTPSGFKTRFYMLANGQHYKEFWVPCTRRPGWNKAMEEEARDECPTELDYQHEHLAEWAVAEGGVFNLNYVKDAIYDYTYYSDETPNDLPSFTYNKDWIYCIGVDLNEDFGDAAIVLGWNPEDEYWYVVDKGSVERSEYTQVAGMDLIISLNRRWHPKFIYMDKKPSATSFEILKRYGMEQSHSKSGSINPDSRLAYILKQFDFGANIEAPDLRGRIIKRVVKSFIIGLTVRRFEQRQIRFPRKDKLLHQQIIDYAQKTQPSGRVVYIKGNQGDHWLDALMLSIMAFALEFSELGKSRQSIGVAFGPSFGKSDETLKTRETTVVERAIHFIPTQRHKAYNSMKTQMLKSLDNRRTRERHKYEIKKNPRRY